MPFSRIFFFKNYVFLEYNVTPHNGQLLKALKNFSRITWKPLPTAAQPLELVTSSVKGESLFLGKMSLLFLTQTVDFSSPGPKEFDYFCFKQYKGDTISTKNILTDFSFFLISFLWICFKSGKLCVSIINDYFSGFLASYSPWG